MFERPPFTDCPDCGHEQGLGVLWISSQSYDRRCKFCGTNKKIQLPVVDKKVLYLDQFAISEIFKLKERKRPSNSPHSLFWIKASKLLDQAMIRQGIICPASNIHRDETMVYRDGEALSLAHEMMGGDTSFKNTTTIEHLQIYRHLDAYLKGEDPPPFDFNVDKILRGHRNAWLPDLHITVNTDWSEFVENTRSARDRASERFAPLYDRWARDKPSFETVLNDELGGLARGYVDAYRQRMAMAQAGETCGDAEQYINGALSPVVKLVHSINRTFAESGTPPELAFRETVKLSWPKNHSLPHHWISSHLFAAIAHRLASGQKHPSRGMMNDIKAISSYGPYVDAMFLDNECASLLKEKAVMRGVSLNAKIFCLKRSDKFIDYLKNIIDSTPTSVINAARDVYGYA